MSLSPRVVVALCSVRTWLPALAGSCLLVVPAAVYAQETSIAGVVRDASGGVLPGVTVEAASSALIEKARTAVTDGAGNYKIISLVPGRYTVTFTLQGFTTLKREGVEVQAETTTQVNADLRVGAVAETVTVTGAAPIVDMQNVAARRVMTREVMDLIPTGRNIQAIGILMPGTGLQVGGGGALSRDVGGSGSLQQSPLSYRGSVASVQTVEGMRLNNLCGSGQYSGNYWNDGMFQEISFSTGADSAEMGQGGLRINMIPKDGGNTYKGTLFGNYTGGEAWNADNLTDGLKTRGLTNVSRIQRVFDFNPSYGGPIKRDTLWFQGTFRRQALDKTVVDSYFDANPNPVRYTADLTRPGIDDGYIMSGVVRLSWQASQKNKVTTYYDRQKKSRGHWGISATNPPEASAQQVVPLSYTTNVKWTSTISSRLLFEAGFSKYYQEYDEIYQPSVTPTTYRITDQITSRSCCAYTSEQFHFSTLRTYSTKLSYVTGSHNLSGGLTVSEGPRRTLTHRTGDLTMRFGNTTVNADAIGFGPNQVTLALPTDQKEGIHADTGLWVNDKWTIKRATITAGLRFDWFIGEVLESSVLPSIWTPATTFAGFTDAPNWKDLSPRFGVAYDLFGNGKTAVKASVSRFVDAQTVGFAAALNPISLLSDTVSLTWTDNNGDFTIFNPDGSVQDQDFNRNTTANELAPIPASSRFGSVQSNTRVDDAIRQGWFVRGYSWEFSGGIQHELVPRVSVGFNYYRRLTGGNNVTTDNLNIGPSDYRGPFCVTAPADPRLPNGGGFQMCDIYELTQAAADRPADNFRTLTKNFGVDRVSYNHGYELNVNARLARGTIIQGGISADRAVSDDCYTATLGNPGGARVNPITGGKYCHDVTPFRPDLKVLASHTFPGAIQVSGTYQRVQGPGILATWTYSQSAANAAGFALTTTTGSTAAQIAAANRSINLLQTGQQYGSALNQLDVRMGKRFNAGKRRVQLMADLYNVFNSDWVFSQNNTLGTNYTISGTWLRPTNVLTARMFKIGAQIDF